MKTSAKSVVATVLIFLSGSAAHAANSCSRADRLAVTEANKMLAVMVENAPLECAPVPDGKQCSLLCASTYSMTDGQSRAALVWIVGAVGLMANAHGVGHFSVVSYLDRDTAKEGYGFTAKVERVADIQRQAKANQLDARAGIKATEMVFTKKYSKQNSN